MDTTDEWIRERTGVETRYFVDPGTTTSQLGERAARRALEMAGLEPGDIDLVVFATMTPDYFFPGCGGLLVHRLGMKPTPAFDLRQQCTGFLYGLQLADAHIRAGLARRVLVVGAEVHSGFMPWKEGSWRRLRGEEDAPLAEGEWDVNTRTRHLTVLFGDAAAAFVIEARDDDGHGVIDTMLFADGGEAERLCVPGIGFRHRPYVDAGMVERADYVPVMDGRHVFRMATTRMSEVAQAVIARNGVTADQVAMVLMHQANKRINEFAQKHLGLPDHKVPHNIHKYANTTAGTIPLLWDECVRDGRIRPGRPRRDGRLRRRHDLGRVAGQGVRRGMGTRAQSGRLRASPPAALRRPKAPSRQPARRASASQGMDTCRPQAHSEASADCRRSTQSPQAVACSCRLTEVSLRPTCSARTRDQGQGEGPGTRDEGREVTSSPEEPHSARADHRAAGPTAASRGLAGAGRGAGTTAARSAGLRRVPYRPPRARRRHRPAASSGCPRARGRGPRGRDGTGASRFRAGARVGVPWLGSTCGTCSYCASGRENLCERAEFTGFHLARRIRRVPRGRRALLRRTAGGVWRRRGGAAAVRRPDRLPLAGDGGGRPPGGALWVRSGRASCSAGGALARARGVRVHTSRRRGQPGVRAPPRRRVGRRLDRGPPQPRSTRPSSSRPWGPSCRSPCGPSHPAVSWSAAAST